MNLASTLERPVSPTLRAASVRVSRLLSATPERVFDAWLNTDDARTFLFAARGGSAGAISAALDARVGGRFALARRRPGADLEYSGEYLEIDRPNRLVFSLFVEKYAQHDDRVIVELAAVATQSLLVVTHELSLPDPAARARIRRAWAVVLDRLTALCIGGDAGRRAKTLALQAVAPSGCRTAPPIHAQ